MLGVFSFIFVVVLVSNTSFTEASSFKSGHGQHQTISLFNFILCSFYKKASSYKPANLCAGTRARRCCPVVTLEVKSHADDSESL